MLLNASGEFGRYGKVLASGEFGRYDKVHRPGVSIRLTVRHIRRIFIHYFIILLILTMSTLLFRICRLILSILYKNVYINVGSILY